MIFTYINGKWSGTLNGAQMTGEKIPGDLANWTSIGTDPNLIVQATYDLLQRRSMTLYHTYGPVAAAVNKQVQYAIGPGNLFRSQPDHEILGISPEAAKKWGKKFQKLVHYYYLGINWYAKQSPLMASAMAGGDSFLFFLRDKKDHSFDLIDTGGDIVNYQAEGTTLGIFTDQYLRRKGIAKVDGTRVDFQNANGDQNVVQLYFKELSRQLRGFSLAYKGINLAKNHDRLWDATVQRAVLETIMIGYSETGTTDFRKQMENMKNANNAMKGGSTGDTNIFKKLGNAVALGAGSLFQLKQNESIKFTELRTPSNNFAEFDKAMINVIGMITGTPGQVISSDYPTSFTSHKGTFNDFIKSYMMRRRTFNGSVGYPVLRETAKFLILNGLIEAPGFFDNKIIQRAYLSGKYLGPVPGAINPLQEVKGKAEAVKQGFMLRSEGANDYENDFDNMLNEYAEEEKKFVEANPEKKALLIKKELQNNG